VVDMNLTSLLPRTEKSSLNNVEDAYAFAKFDNVEVIAGKAPDIDEEVDDRVNSKFIPLLLLDDYDVLIFIKKLYNSFYSLPSISTLSSLTPFSFITSNCDEELKNRLFHFQLFDNMVIYMNSFEFEKTFDLKAEDCKNTPEWNISYDTFINVYLEENRLNENSEIRIPQIYYHFKLISQIFNNFIFASNTPFILYSSAEGGSAEVPLSKRILLTSLYSENSSTLSQDSRFEGGALYIPSFFEKFQSSTLLLYFLKRLSLSLDYLMNSALLDYFQRPLYAFISESLYIALMKSPIYVIINIICFFIGEYTLYSMSDISVIMTRRYEETNILARTQLMTSIFSSLLFILADNFSYLISFPDRVVFSKEIDISISLFFTNDANISDNKSSKAGGLDSAKSEVKQSASSSDKISLLTMFCRMFEDIIIYGTLTPSIYLYSPIASKELDDLSPLYAFPFFFPDQSSNFFYNNLCNYLMSTDHHLSFNSSFLLTLSTAAFVFTRTQEGTSNVSLFPYYLCSTNVFNSCTKNSSHLLFLYPLPSFSILPDNSLNGNLFYNVINSFHPSYDQKSFSLIILENKKKIFTSYLSGMIEVDSEDTSKMNIFELIVHFCRVRILNFDKIMLDFENSIGFQSNDVIIPETPPGSEKFFPISEKSHSFIFYRTNFLTFCLLIALLEKNNSLLDYCEGKNIRIPYSSFSVKNPFKKISSHIGGGAPPLPPPPSMEGYVPPTAVQTPSCIEDPSSQSTLFTYEFLRNIPFLRYLVYYLLSTTSENLLTKPRSLSLLLKAFGSLAQHPRFFFFFFIYFYFFFFFKDNLFFILSPQLIEKVLECVQFFFFFHNIIITN
jgi:hypothetical protein